VTQPPTEQVRQLLRGVVAVIDAAHQRVLERDTASRALDVPVDRFHEHGNGIAPVDRHQFRALLVFWRMQGNRQVDRQVFLRECFDTRHDA
jgi:hypothetical protein